MPRDFQGKKGFTYGGRGDDAVSIERSFRELYYLINYLFSKSNVYAEGQDISYKGSPGDIRVVKVGETKSDPLYAVEARTPDGWFRIKGDLQTKAEGKAAKFPASSHYLPLTPDYESDWTDITVGTAYTFTHNLDTKLFTLVQIVFKDDNDRIWYPGVYMWDDSNSDNRGLCMWAKTENVVEVGTQTHSVFAHGHTSLSENYDVNDGYIKVRLWK